MLLDLKRDRYVGIGGTHVSALSQLIIDWPAGIEATACSTPTPDTHACAQKLHADQMLADACGPAVRSITLDVPRRTLDAGTRVATGSHAWRDIASLARAASSTALALRRRCLAEMADSVTRLRPQTTGADASPKLSELGAAVSSYMRLRPFLFTSNDQCLHDSLTLVRFLSSRGLFPTWVIGVRIGPFGAHSWVQSGDVVLNDVHEHARSYTPILVV